MKAEKQPPPRPGGRKAGERPGVLLKRLLSVSQGGRGTGPKRKLRGGGRGVPKRVGVGYVMEWIFWEGGDGTPWIKDGCGGSLTRRRQTWPKASERRTNPPAQGGQIRGWERFRGDGRHVRTTTRRASDCVRRQLKRWIGCSKRVHLPCDALAASRHTIERGGEVT